MNSRLLPFTDYTNKIECDRCGDDIRAGKQYYATANKELILCPSCAEHTKQDRPATGKESQ